MTLLTFPYSTGVQCANRWHPQTSIWSRGCAWQESETHESQTVPSMPCCHPSMEAKPRPSAWNCWGMNAGELRVGNWNWSCLEQQTNGSSGETDCGFLPLSSTALWCFCPGYLQLACSSGAGKKQGVRWGRGRLADIRYLGGWAGKLEIALAVIV